MTRLEDRQTLAAAVAQACAEWPRLRPTCALAGIDVRTFQRCKIGEDLTPRDRQPDVVRPVPPRALNPAEWARIVPVLASEGVYLASEAAPAGRRDVRSKSSQAVAGSCSSVWTGGADYCAALPFPFMQLRAYQIASSRIPD